MSDAPVPWSDLRRFTPARVGLGRVGSGLPTAAHLAFQADHAAARDAVHAELDVDRLRADLAASAPDVALQEVASRCSDRATYLVRPDLGRQLAPCSLEPHPGVAFVLCDGLSPTALQRHAVPVLVEARRLLLEAGTAAAGVVVARQARVALGDAVAAELGAEAVVVLIGERPGLSSADSLGAYVTWHPHAGTVDADRNCISNIRAAGLSPVAAASKVAWLLREMRALGTSGVALKDDEPRPQVGRSMTSQAALE